MVDDSLLQATLNSTIKHFYTRQRDGSEAFTSYYESNPTPMYIFPLTLMGT